MSGTLKCCYLDLAGELGWERWRTSALSRRRVTYHVYIDGPLLVPLWRG